MPLCRASGEPGLLALHPGWLHRILATFLLLKIYVLAHNVMYRQNEARPASGCILTSAVMIRNVQVRSLKTFYVVII